MITNSITTRLPRLLLLLGLVSAIFFWAAPRAAAEEYDETLDRLDRLQQLATDYAADSEDDPILLTLSYTRTGDYNTAMWQLTAGARDTEFDSYVEEHDADLSALQGMNTVTLPNGQQIDFGHLLASMNLVYNGLPITGSWGGDCTQLAQAYAGQASDAAGYADLMRDTFAIDDDGSTSKFGDQDLRADLEDPSLKVPHMGWNSLRVLRDDPLFRYFRDGEYVCYVHSFYARNCTESTLAVSQYGNVAVTGVVRSGNVWGTQFHPEKSGDAGLRLLKAFGEL